MGALGPGTALLAAVGQRIGRSVATLRLGFDQRFLFPALASVSHGCLRVALQGDRLMAEGPVASRPFASLQVHHPEHQANLVRFDPPSSYMELNSVSLRPLLGSLFNNSLSA